MEADFCLAIHKYVIESLATRKNNLYLSHLLFDRSNIINHKIVRGQFVPNNMSLVCTLEVTRIDICKQCSYNVSFLLRCYPLSLLLYVHAIEDCINIILQSHSVFVYQYMMTERF